jgi:hypothetical protein
MGGFGHHGVTVLPDIACLIRSHPSLIEDDRADRVRDAGLLSPAKCESILDPTILFRIRQFARVGNLPLTRTLGRPIRLGQRPIGVSPALPPPNKASEKHERSFASRWRSPSGIADAWPMSTKDDFTISRLGHRCSIAIGRMSIMEAKNGKHGL